MQSQLNARAYRGFLTQSVPLTCGKPTNESTGIYRFAYWIFGCHKARSRSLGNEARVDWLWKRRRRKVPALVAVRLATYSPESPPFPRGEVYNRKMSYALISTFRTTKRSPDVYVQTASKPKMRYLADKNGRLPELRTKILCTEILHAIEAWSKIDEDELPKRLGALLLPLQTASDPVGELLFGEDPDRERDLVAGFVLLYIRYSAGNVHHLMGLQGVEVKSEKESEVKSEEPAENGHSLMSALNMLSTRFLGRYRALVMNARFKREQQRDPPSDIRYTFHLLDTVIPIERSERPMSIAAVHSVGGARDQSVSGTTQKTSCLHYDLGDTELGSYLTGCVKDLTEAGDYTESLSGPTQQMTYELPKSKI